MNRNVRLSETATATATATPTGSRSRNSASIRTSELNRALALVRPVGMSDEMASDWLAAALGECLYLTDEQFKRGCAAARRECSHHAQIIPAIIRAAGESVNMTDRYIRDWNNAALAYERGYKSLTHTPDKQIGGQIAGYLENIKITDEEF